MRLFLLSFFTIYGMMHAYAFLRARTAFGLDWKSGILLAAVMLVMLLAPLIVWLMEKSGMGAGARVLSLMGYMWLGILFLFVSISLLLDIYLFAASGAGLLLKKDIVALAPSAKTAFYVPLVLAIALAAYGYFAAMNIQTEKITVKTTKLPPDVHKLRIVQLSDVHLGLIIRGSRLKRMLDEVRKLEPDMVVSTGDLVDGQINDLPGLADMLRELNPQYGKYAITGNHEFYAGMNQALQFTENAGFRVLRGEGLTSVINIAGVEDPTGRYFDSDRFVPEGELLSGLKNGKFTLLLKHRPEIDKSARGLFDLQLSGHTHKGQIFPFYLATRIFYPPSGENIISDGSMMYLSRGTGTWGPPVRLLAPPEITLIELVKG